MRLVALVLAGCCFGVVQGFAGLADAAVFADWETDCRGEPRACVVSQTVFAKDRSWLATVRLAPAGADHATEGAITLQFLVPPSVHLASGVFVSVRHFGAMGDPVEIPYIRCNPRACEAVVSLDAEQFSEWRKGSHLEVRYRPSITSPPVIFDVSLSGITMAFGHALESLP